MKPDSVPFDYALDYENTDFRKHPELYHLGKGKQGVLLIEPYKKKAGDELPRTEDTAKAAAAAIFYDRSLIARQNPEYLRQRKLHQQKFEGK
jgi:hypothetical protein